MRPVSVRERFLRVVGKRQKNQFRALFLANRIGSVSLARETEKRMRLLTILYFFMPREPPPSPEPACLPSADVINFKQTMKDLHPVTNDAGFANVVQQDNGQALRCEN